MEYLQLLTHLWGDYIFQSDWMAQNKTKAFWPAYCHAVVYSIPFLLFRPSLRAFAVILFTHYLIDRYRLARYVVWAKNFMGAPVHWFCLYECHKIQEELNHRGKCGSCQMVRNLPFAECATTGYLPNSPAWLSVWLLIIADNIIHLTINYAALRWL